jgi:glycerophosphoryl diester phosphodiesterase
MTAVGLEMSLLTPERVQDYEQLGILPWAYCPDDDRQAAYARYCDVWLVTCNDPGPAMRLFKG